VFARLVTNGDSVESGVREGRWMLTVNLGLSPGYFGPVPKLLAAGVAISIANIGIAPISVLLKRRAICPHQLPSMQLK
jgi:hypothetical protein